jgi:TATA-box binding protein (TBP) (component of TFIID and TFIIIB)
MESFEGRFERSLRSILQQTRQLEHQISLDTQAPQIVNLVNTVQLLPQIKDPVTGKPVYKLPLESISMILRSCSQFAPRQFAANVLRLKDNITDTTSLIFRSGKIVTVRNLSENHTTYVSQLFRIVIERVRAMMRDPDTGRVFCGTLEGRCTFDTCSIRNVVGSGDLGIQVDLPKLKCAAPHYCKYEPAIFPGLKFRVWTPASQKCVCAMSFDQQADDDDDDDDEDEAAIAEVVVDLKTKCICVVKCLIFDSGKLVITGGKSVQVVYDVFQRIKRLAVQFEDKEDNTVPREKRFRHRLSRMMINAGILEAEAATTTGSKGSGGKRARQQQQKGRPVLERILNEDEALAAVLVGLTDFKPNQTFKKAKRNPKHMDVSVTPLMRMVDRGRLKNVITLLSMDPQQAFDKDGNGHTALDRLRAAPVHERHAEHHDDMCQVLEEHMQNNKL